MSVNDNDADSVHSMAKTPPPGSPKATFLSNGVVHSHGSPPNDSHGGRGSLNGHANNNNSDNEEDLSPPPISIHQPPGRKQHRERYWGLNTEADSTGDWGGPQARAVGGAIDEPPDSPTGAISRMRDDDMSEISSQMPRSKSRTDLDRGGGAGKPTTAKYNNLSFWKARRMMFYRNGDPFFPGIEFIFKPGRDIISIDALLDKLTKRMDLPRGARFVFDMAGDRKYTLDDLEDGASYVVSSFKVFKVSSSVRPKISSLRSHYHKHGANI